MSLSPPVPFDPSGWIHAVRRAWRRSVLGRGILGAIFAAALVSAVLVLLDQLVAFPSAARAVLRLFVPVVALTVLGPALLRVLAMKDDTRFALLAEERDARLGHLLSTALSTPGEGAVGRAFQSRLRASLSAIAPTFGLDLRAAAARALVGGVLLLACVALVPGGATELGARWLHLVSDPATGLGPSPDLVIGRTADDAAKEFRNVRIVIEPPAYTGTPGSPVDAESIVALAGSVLRVTGVGPAGAVVSARVLGGGDASVIMDDDGFRIRHVLTTADRGLEILAFTSADTLARRVLAIDAVPDAPPVVALVEPAEDVVVATAHGVIPIVASAHDDYGIADFQLAWILSSGSGESFSFSDGGAAWDAISDDDGVRTGRFALDLAGFGLGPGDVLHVRAAARDGNDVTGPGEGVSATRLIRIAREGQEDEATTLIGFPLEPEKDPILSQRMIILLTEKLIERALALSAAAVRTESEDIARQQARLRERLADIIYARSSGEEHQEGSGGAGDLSARRPPIDSLPPGERERRMQEILDAASAATGQGTLEEMTHEHDPDPALMVNLPLVPAFNAMYEAERWLRQTDPRSALPHERRALEIIQRVREAERVYLRGSQTVAPVDVAGVRGTGKLDDADPAARAEPRPVQSIDAHLDALTSLAARLSSMPPRAAALALSGLSARLLEDPAIDRRSGGELALAATAARAGRMDDARSGLVRARGLLSPPAGAAVAAPDLPATPEGARYLAPAGSDTTPDRAVERFVFATARYASGDWDSGQLVPANLIHSVALYTDIPVAPEGVVVDLDSPDLFRYPLVFLTGHLPVRFTAAEAANLRSYVDRGGFVFIDDHNHDIDGAFHRTVLAEIERVFGPRSLVAIPEQHELYRSFFTFEDGPPTTSHELNGWGDGLIHEELFGVLRPDGRIGVLYSNKDYSSEWSYHVQNKRFLSLDNTRFGVNVVVYALTR